MKTPILLLLALLLSPALYSQSRWHITPDSAIRWEIRKNIPHDDHIEMSGESVSAVLRYGVNADGSFRLERSMIWPMLRTVPNNTHASLMQRFGYDLIPTLIVNGKSLKNERVRALKLDGTLSVESDYSDSYASASSETPPYVTVNRTIFPSTTLPMLCESYRLKNSSGRALTVEIPDYRAVWHTDSQKGVDGSYTLVVKTDRPATVTLKPGEEITFGCSVQAYKNGQKEHSPDINAELLNRQAFLREMKNELVLDCPDTIISTAFAFAKIRSSESIFRTAGGLMHGPGGESYYAAVWANDQAEYVGPFFPYLGYCSGNESSLNAYRHFARFMNDDYRPIPSSIIAEGKDIWNGAGDRGDAAMIAYGAARYALVRGDKTEAETLWPLITWCLEYCKRQQNEQGAIKSDHDELEGRFPAGEANLCTSTLYYDALLSASYLGKELGKPAAELSRYKKEAEALHKAINGYFSATIDGYDCYRYYDGNDKLRSWICMPLIVGIFERAAGTIDALFSPQLWTSDGLLTEAGSSTFWDRSTLYALRGVYAAGATEKATAYLHDYSAQRLLGEHVPYPIEAWPEGSQRHLSAESGLYCRIITEGLFGIRPTGLNRFSLTPRLPEGWPYMTLNRMNGFGKTVNISVKRINDKLEITVSDDRKTYTQKQIRPGKTIEVEL